MYRPTSFMVKYQKVILDEGSLLVRLHMSNYLAISTSQIDLYFFFIRTASLRKHQRESAIVAGFLGSGTGGSCDCF